MLKVYNAKSATNIGVSPAGNKKYGVGVGGEGDMVLDPRKVDCRYLFRRVNRIGY